MYTNEKSPARATNTDKATKKNTLSIKYTERGRLSNGILVDVYNESTLSMTQLGSIFILNAAERVVFDKEE